MSTTDIKEQLMRTEVNKIFNRLWKDLYGDNTAGIFEERSLAFIEAIDSVVKALTTMQEAVEREERKKAQSIVNAWIVEGISPSYHEATKQELKEIWPTLYYAILTYIHSLKK